GRRLRRGGWAARARRAAIPGSSERRGDARGNGWREVQRGAARRLSLAAPGGGVRALGGGTLRGAAAARARTGRGAGRVGGGARGPARAGGGGAPADPRQLRSRGRTGVDRRARLIKHRARRDDATGGGAREAPRAP